MVQILDPQVATQPISGVLSLTGQPTTISLVNLGILGTNVSGAVPLAVNRTQTYSIQTADEANSQLTVGEAFSVVRRETNTTTGAQTGLTTANYEMVGSGTVTGALGTPRTAIVARNVATNQLTIIYPNNVPPNIVGLVSLTYNFRPVGFDFNIAAPLCLARGTMIATPDGLRAVETLKVGDLVETKDHGPQPIRWIGARAIDAQTLAAQDNMQPIRIAAGALGAGTPSSDLIVSPQHRILVRSGIAQKMFGTKEVLVAAKQLLLLDGIDVASDMTEVEYFHFMFDRHEVITAAGAETESLYTGEEALKSVGIAARDEIFAIFPELAEEGYEAVAARTLASGRVGRRLAHRHLQNGKSLVQ